MTYRATQRLRSSELISVFWSSESVESLGKCFSAPSNEANLKNQECGWLVLGVRDMPRAMVGTGYRPERPALDSLKQQVAVHTTNHLTFGDIYELMTAEGRVVMFRIPRALPGVPTAWKGFPYGRDGESLGPLNPHEQDQIRDERGIDDWSARVCEQAGLAHRSYYWSPITNSLSRDLGDEHFGRERMLPTNDQLR